MENKAFQIFVLKALRKLAWATLTGKYEIREIEDIYNETKKRVDYLENEDDT